MTEPQPDLCGATAEDCVCDQPVGHADPHHCTRDQCGGQWTGDYETDDFDVVRFPLEGEYPFGTLWPILRFGTL